MIKNKNESQINANNFNLTQSYVYHTENKTTIASNYTDSKETIKNATGSINICDYDNSNNLDESNSENGIFQLFFWYWGTFCVLLVIFISLWQIYKRIKRYDSQSYVLKRLV